VYGTFVAHDHALVATSHSRSSWFPILPHHRRDPTFSSSTSIDPARIGIDAAVGFALRRHLSPASASMFVCS
jgi:hypothetical protein